MSGVLNLGYSDGHKTKFTVCSPEVESPWFYLCWNLGKPFKDQVSEPIIYHQHGEGHLKDYPVTNAGQFLISERMLQVIESTNSKFDKYESQIITPTGKVIENYYTLNFTESYIALDKELSVYSNSPINPDKIRHIKKLVLKKSLIPPNVDIFRLAENTVTILISSKLKKAFEEAKLTGLRYEQVQES